MSLMPTAKVNILADSLFYVFFSSFTLLTVSIPMLVAWYPREVVTTDYYVYETGTKKKKQNERTSS